MPEDPSPPTAVEPRPGLTHAGADWAGLRVAVVGLGISGFAAADALLERGADVTVLSPDLTPVISERATILDILGAHLLLADRAVGDTAAQAVRDAELVVVSPGVRPSDPLMRAAAAARVPVWGEVELAWRMRPAEGAAPWLTITGTNGKTTTVKMLASILTAAGLRATAAGNVGTPLIEAVLHPQPYDVIAVELSSFQLHWSHTLSPVASVCLNVAPDHLDWHGSYEAYLAAKGRVYANTHIACIYNVEDPQTEQLVRDAEVVEGCRAVGFTLGIPAISMLGVVEDVLADRAFVEQRAHSAAELGTLHDLQGGASSLAPHYVANALAAAALARAYGVGPIAVRDGLRSFRPEPHRIAEIATVEGVRYVDDSKATNPHAAGAALAAYDSIVWVAGGQLKGADVDALVAKYGDRLRAVVLLGVDRHVIATSLARHAPDVPVVDVSATDTGVMDLVVGHAAGLAQPGDVVLLSPAAASLDMFSSYGQRGDLFADAVRRHLDTAQ
jgi:UDP-N-acetylmuramoylalanine--D-glutamate ligase